MRYYYYYNDKGRCYKSNAIINFKNFYCVLRLQDLPKYIKIVKDARTLKIVKIRQDNNKFIKV